MIASRIDAELERLSARLEEATELHARLAQDAAEAEVAYKLAKAKALLGAEGRSAVVREAAALLVVADEYTAHRMAEGRLAAQVELLRSLRAQLSVLQTLARTIGAQT